MPPSHAPCLSCIPLAILLLPCRCTTDVLDAFASQGRVDKCQEWLQQVVEAGLTPDDHTYHSLAKAYVTTSQFLPAIELLNSLETAGHPASMATYTLVIDVCSIHPTTAETWIGRSGERATARSASSRMEPILPYAIARTPDPRRSTLRFNDQGMRARRTSTARH